MRRARGIVRELLALSVALGLVSFQDPGGDEAGGAARGPAADPTPPAENRGRGLEAGAIELAAPRLDHALTIEEIEASLEALAATYPGFAAIETIGESRGGRPIRVLTITDPAGGAAFEKPAVLLADHRAAQGAYGAEACLAVGWRLVERARAEPRIAGWLVDHALILAPALDPDQRAADGPAVPDEVRFDRNFPLGWRPATLRSGSGDAPLSKPETRAAAAFLATRPNLVVVAGGRDREVPEGAPFAGAEVPAEDAELLRRLCAESRAGEPKLTPWTELGSPGGSLFDHAYQALGVYPIAWEAPPENDGPVLESWVSGVARRMGRLLEELPTLRIEEAGLVQLAPGLWQLDVALRNAGAIPTLSALAGKRRVPGDLALELSGAEVVATARRSAPEEAFRAARLHGGTGLSLSGGVLDGGETRWLRIVLEGEPGAVLEVQGAAPRGGRAELTVALR